MPKSSFTIFSGSSHPELANEVAKKVKGKLGEIKLSTFSSGEKYAVLEQSVRGKDVFIVQTCRDQHINDDYMELFMMINAAKLSFAKNVYVIIPHLGYARQDKIHLPREPISAKVIADIVTQSGATSVITFELHSDQTQGFFGIPVDNIKTGRIFADYFKKKKLKDLTIVSPDAGGAKNTKKFADYLGAPIAILHKSRPSHNKAITTHVVGDVKGRTCIIYDDMIDTAGSVVAAREALLKSGANKEMYLSATHPIFSGPAAERLKKAGFTEVVVSNTMPLGKEKQFKGLKQISVAPLLADVIKSISEHRSVSSLFS